MIESSPSRKTLDQKVDLTRCDLEPIHLIGGIQRHGCLIVLEQPDFIMIQASENVLDYLEVPAEKLLGKPIGHWLNPVELKGLTSELEHSAEMEQAQPLQVTFLLPAGPKKFTALIHASEAPTIAVLELEPVSTYEQPLLTFIDCYGKFSDSIGKLQCADSVQSLCDQAVREVRNLTGFDRVWVHRVVEGDHLKVISEERREDQNPFLGLHFPASDIPKQARRLYVLNRLRFISDVNALPSPLIPLLNPLTQAPLDLSKSYLRAVSPVHLEYLKNIHVQASMSISLVKDGKLWGLISCHHDSSWSLDYKKRALCEFIGRIVSLQIPILERQEEAQAELKLRTHLIPVLSLITSTAPESLLHAIELEKEHFLAITNATGGAVCHQGRTPLLLGKCPPRDAVRALSQFVMSQEDHKPYVTDELAKVWPAAGDWASQASGLLAVSFSKDDEFVIMWFRPEQIQMIPWGGDPNKPVLPSATGDRLSPRKSFALWNETVRGKSLPWLPSERQMVAEFLVGLMHFVIERTQELRLQNQELERSNQELDSFAYIASHDLKEPLRGIHSYASFLIEDYGEVLDEKGRQKLNRLLTMTARMNALIDSLLKFSRVGRTNLELQEVDLNTVAIEAIDTLRPRLESANAIVKIEGKLPTLRCDPIRLTEVFHNLILNAVKYNDSAEKRVEISSSQRKLSSGKLQDVLAVRDNGIGIDPKYHELVFQIFKRLHLQDAYGGGSGAGLTIVKKIIERHGGSIWLESALGKGSTFFFSLEASQISEALPDRRMPKLHQEESP